MITYRKTGYGYAHVYYKKVSYACVRLLCTRYLRVVECTGCTFPSLISGKPLTTNYAITRIPRSTYNPAARIAHYRVLHPSTYIFQTD